MFIAFFFYFMMWVTMMLMVFNVCVIDTLQRLYISINPLIEDYEL